MKNYLVVLGLLFCYQVMAQEKIKFGNVSPEEVQMKSYEKDLNASAVVLYESMDTRYIYNTAGLQVINDYFVRIKILTNDGLEYADQAISYYTGTSRSESDQLSGLTGFTYNWENDKTEKIKLSKEYIFDEKVSNSLMRTKFAFQSVKPGSVIEYKYTITSPRYSSLNDFVFQRSIPVQYSCYRLLIPEYFKFNKETKGMEPIKVTTKNQNQSFNLRGTNQLNFFSEDILFEAKDLPALKDENYIWSIKDYLTRVTFELKGIEIPGSVYKTYTNSWPTADEQLTSYDDFGKQFNLKLFKDELSGLFTPDMNEQNKIRAIYNMVRSKVSWNDQKTLWAKNPKEALKKGLGSSGEINAILISALREAGFDAYPVVMSLKNKGRIPISHATIDNLNYFVVGVDIEGKPIYLDASAKYGDLNVLPPNCMSDFTRSIRNNKLSTWIDLSRINKSKKTVNISMEFNDEGILSGNVLDITTGEIRYGFRSKFHDYKNQEEYIEKRETEDNIRISDYEVTGMDNNSDRSFEKFNFTSPEITTQEDLIYFNPIMVPIFSENPFKTEDRKLPVEFSYPYEIQIVSKIKIPKGYVVEEMPEQKKINLNNNDASFIYITAYSEGDNSFSVMAKFSLDKIIYTLPEYPQLRDFFTYLTTANNTQIVLKRK